MKHDLAKTSSSNLAEAVSSTLRRVVVRGSRIQPPTTLVLPATPRIGGNAGGEE